MYINRNDVIEKIEAWKNCCAGNDSYSSGYEAGLKAAQELVKQMPEAEVVTVERARAVEEIAKSAKAWRENMMKGECEYTNGVNEGIARGLSYAVDYLRASGLELPVNCTPISLGRVTSLYGGDAQTEVAWFGFGVRVDMDEDEPLLRAAITQQAKEVLGMLARNDEFWDVIPREDGKVDVVYKFALDTKNISTKNYREVKDA